MQKKTVTQKFSKKTFENDKKQTICQKDFLFVIKLQQYLVFIFVSEIECYVLILLQLLRDNFLFLQANALDKD